MNQFSPSNTANLPWFNDEPEVVGDTAECHREFGSAFTTARQAMQGQDIQGIPWADLMRTREHYRQQRFGTYRNFTSLQPTPNEVELVNKEVTPCINESRLFSFRNNTSAVTPTYVHFQLRHLVWCTSSYDVYLLEERNNETSVVHWNALTQRSRKCLDLSLRLFNGADNQAVQISTMAVGEGLLIVGGFRGDLICMNLDTAMYYCNKRVTPTENITNAIETIPRGSGGVKVVTSNNDNTVRVFDVPSFTETLNFQFTKPVNHTSVSPDGRQLCCVGDMQQVHIVDVASATRSATLKGHIDFGFSSAWHANGHLLATGNQDKTCRVWDLRYASRALAVLKGNMSAIRSLRFDNSGRTLAFAEAADFLHCVDVVSGFERKQEIDMFGEICGFAFTPDDEGLFVGVSDPNFASLLEYRSNIHDTFSLVDNHTNPSAGMIV